MIGNNQRIPRKNRCSVDLDSFNQLNMLKAYYNAFMFSKHVILFTTKHGYHIHMGGTFEPKEKVEIRRMLGGDWARLWVDDDRIRFNDSDSVDTLFGKKRRWGKWSGEELAVPLSEAFYKVRNQ